MRTQHSRPKLKTLLPLLFCPLNALPLQNFRFALPMPPKSLSTTLTAIHLGNKNIQQKLGLLDTAIRFIDEELCKEFFHHTPNPIFINSKVASLGRGRVLLDCRKNTGNERLAIQFLRLLRSRRRSVCRGESFSSSTVRPAYRLR